MAVHGWLFLLLEQDIPTNGFTPIPGYFVHHTPEFWTDSPHNFQIIMKGTLVPISTTQNITYPIDLPYPPKMDLIQNEYTFTPPPAFSLNDLLAGSIVQLNGVVFNGSFDTSYERVPVSLGSVYIEELSTAVYLDNSTSLTPHQTLLYYSYPRNIKIVSQGQQHYYFSHFIHSVPDFDQVIHAVIDLDGCVCENCRDKQQMYEWIHESGAVWDFHTISNDVRNRLKPREVESARLTSAPQPNSVLCKVVVLEEIHCVVGPAFFNIC